MEFDYQVVRSDRKSLCINISPSGLVLVKCPKGATDRLIEKLVNEKKKWIIGKLTEKLKISEQNLDIKNLQAIYIGGIKKRLIFADYAAIDEDNVFIKSLKDIKRILCKACSDEFFIRIKKLSQSFGMGVESYKIRSYKSRWGCCDAHKNLSFNYILLMLPIDIQNYVIVHELCHTVYMNHSKNFWDLVNKLMPEYKVCRKRLKEFNYLIDVYC